MRAPRAGFRDGDRPGRTARTETRCRRSVRATPLPCPCPVPEYRMNAGDVVVGVVRVAEGMRRIQRLTNTLECGIGLTAPGVQYASKALEPWLVRLLF